MKNITLIICWSLLLVISIPVVSCGTPNTQNAELFNTNMRFVRLRATLLDSSGNARQMVQWNTKGTWEKLTETRWVNKYRMFRYLLIPNAPWMQWYGNISIAVDEKSPIEIIGKEQYHPIKLPGQKEIQLMMWKATFTNNKWVGINRDKILECGEDGVGKQIGWLSFRHLTINSGETLLLYMTKEMGKNDKWEGNAGDTVFIEKKEGYGTPIGKLEFRRVKKENGKETVILMFRSLSDSGNWIGVQNGKVVEFK